LSAAITTAAVDDSFVSCERLDTGKGVACDAVVLITLLQIYQVGRRRHKKHKKHKEELGLSFCAFCGAAFFTSCLLILL
jgi:hypothetical protein